MQDVSNHIIREVFPVEQRVEFLCLCHNVDLKLRIEDGTEIVQAYDSVGADRTVDETMRHVRDKVDPVVLNGCKRGPVA